MRRVDVSLILPCYNESGLFAESVSRIRGVMEHSKFSYEIIFVDDKSHDETPSLIRAVCAGYPKLRAVFHTKNCGRGQSVKDGIHIARGKVVGYIDIDCEVSPVYIPSMVALILMRHADVVIGRRFYRSSPRAIVREVLSRGYQWLSDCLIGTGRLDTESGYKFFNRKKIIPLLKHTKHRGWFWDTEIMVYARRARLMIKEVPVLFLRRFDKTSSVRIIPDTIDYLIHLYRFRRVLQRKAV